MYRMRPHIITQNLITGQEYRLGDDRSRQWFLHAGPDGSGFGYLSWSLKRPIGFDYPDVGFAYGVRMFKGPWSCLFDGQIVRISERSGREGDTIEIWALGWVHLLSDDVLNWVFCDTRYPLWSGSETVSGSFRPDMFDYDLSSRIRFKPRRTVDFLADDYSYVRYAFQFGETATRIKADYDLALPNSWPGKLEVRTSTGEVLLSATVTASGSIDEVVTGSPTYFEVRFYVTAAGENTAEDGTVYGELTNVKVYSANVTTLDAAVIAEKVVSYMAAEAADQEIAIALSDSTTRIVSPDLALEPAAFDSDITLAQIMTWSAQYGDSDGNPLIWGVTFDDRRRLFLEAKDVTTVSYIVDPARADLERGGDWSESFQAVYGVYTDDDGMIQRTDAQEAAAQIAKLGGYRRKVPMQISGTTVEADVEALLALTLGEHSAPTPSGSFVVRQGVTAPTGRWIAFDEIKPGSLVQIKEWRAQEATFSPTDYRDKATTFYLSGVRVDEDGMTVELIPNLTSDAFIRQLSIIQQLQGELS